jgi:hypothetical protein
MRLKMHHPTVFAAIVMVVAVAIPMPAQQLPRPTTLAGRSTVYAPNAAIATSQPLATAAGLAVLEHGGNAIDAAVTTAAVLTVVEPNMTGMGGDLFAMVWSDKDKKLYGLNASGRSGSLMTRETLVERKRTRIVQGIESVTIPGALSGWAALLQKYQARRFVTGHTPQQNRSITVRFGGRAVLIDTGMLTSYYKGRASALEIDGDKLTAYYEDGKVTLP